MRILVANKFLRPVGGVETHVAFVKQWLEAAGHTVVEFAMHEEGAKESAHTKYFPSAVEFGTGRPREAMRAVERATRSSETRRKLAELLAVERIDAAYVVHIYHQLGTVLLNDLAGRGIPTVLSLHDYKVGCPNYRFFSERTNRICTRCLDNRHSALWAPAVERCWAGSRLAGVALSLEAASTRLRQSYARAGAVMVLNSLQERAAIAEGIEPQRIHRIAHPVILKDYVPRRRLNRFLYVGRLVPEKGVDVLIRASSLAKVNVTIAGSGRSEAELRSLAEELDAPVEFIGSVDRSLVAGLMAESKALVVPSTWHEVSPLVVYEAMAADLPVIGSRVGGLVEQLGVDRGLLVEPADVEGLGGAMRELAANDTLGAQLSARARAYAGEFLSMDQWASKMVAAFHAAGAKSFTG